MRNGHNNNNHNSHNNNNNKARMRNRPRGNKSSSPLSKAYESNGPSVKVRGSAHHIAEKYLTLARDAQGSGDYIAYEGFMQHAEHYIRLVTAAHEQMRAINPNWRPDLPLPGQQPDEFDDEDEGDVQENAPPQQQQNQRRIYQNDGEQPEGEPDLAQQQPRRFEPRPPRPKFNEARFGEPRNNEPRFNEAGEPIENDGQGRNQPRGRFNNRFNRDGRPPRQDHGEAAAARVSEEGVENFGLPAFLTAPLPVAAITPLPDAQPAPAVSEEGGEERVFQRRRRPKFERKDVDVSDATAIGE